MPKLDSIGTFLATVAEHSLSLTQKGCPQAVLRLVVDHKFVNTPAEIAHFQKSDPAFAGGWQAWQFEGQEPDEITSYLMLFKDPENFVVEGPGKTATFNYEQLQLALGWDGQAFDAFSDGVFVGKQVLIRTDENVYTPEGGAEKRTIQVAWIDNKDASPERSLKAMDKNDISALNAKLQIKKTVAKPVVASAAKPAVAAPAKPAPAAAAPVAPKPTPAPAKVAKPASPTASSATPAATPSQTAPKSPGKAPVPPAAPKPPVKPPVVAPTPEPAQEDAGDALPAAVDMETAWNTIQERKGTLDDNVVADAWQKGCQEVDTEGKGAGAITEEGWAQVRDIVISDLAL